LILKGYFYVRKNVAGYVDVARLQNFLACPPCSCPQFLWIKMW
jgi:hypothetical protein